MSISIQEALDLPVMESTTLAAGHNGIQNIIKWVTIVEVIEDIERLQDGEFLITTGYGLKENSEEFKRLLGMKKLSGVAIYTGFYLDIIPPSFIEIANGNDLPLIELPININFSTITKSILEQILNKQMEMVSFSLETHKQLTRLVLKNEGANKISDTLARLIGSSIFVISKSNEISYFVKNHKTFIYDEDKILAGNHSSFPYKELSWECQTRKQPIEFELAGFKVLFYPIVANGKNYGCLIACKELEEWQELYLNAIEHAATVYAIEYLKDDAVTQTQIRLQGEFLEELINKNFQTSSIALERAKKLGYDLSNTHVVLHIKLGEEVDNLTLKKSMEPLYRFSVHTMERLRRQFIIRERLDGLIILCEAKENTKTNLKQDSLKTARALLDRWKGRHPDIPLTIGVGKVYPEINQLSESAIEAKYGADLSHLLLSEKEIIHYDDLGTFHLLIQMKERGMSLKEFYEEHLGELLRKSKQGINLIDTLQIYFKNNQNLQSTSEELFIHRHTLKYRLNLIESRSGYNLHSADERLKLQIAIAAYKLEQYYYS